MDSTESKRIGIIGRQIHRNRYVKYVKRAKEKERGRVISIANIGALARCQIDIPESLFSKTCPMNV